MRFVIVVVQHCCHLLVKNFEGTLSDTIFYRLSVMMVTRFSTGVKVVFEEMKSLVQLEIFRLYCNAHMKILAALVQD